MKPENILEVRNLYVKFPITGGIMLRKKGEVKAVDDVSFEIKKGETLGLVGESGCGKSTIGKAIINVLNFATPDTEISGEILLRTEDKEINILKLNNRKMKKYRGYIQVIFQDP
ncbi:MAG: ATP-binding cassette domain-containing protein, partial [Ignavibacteria bacterium]|nr:ATP-binding cassette domain-containing protein [Ignavibacteria bacterium]